MTVIRVEVWLPLLPRAAWELLSDARHRKIWWGDHVEMEASLGGALREVWRNGTRQVITSGSVIRCDPPWILEMTWADDDWPGQTRVSFAFNTDANGTRVTLEHTGWEVHPEGTRQALVDAHSAGWSGIMKQMAEYAGETFGSPPRRQY